jgi:hypothetical protein
MIKVLIKVPARNPELVRGKRVIELGAGVGTPGIAAALSGALEVYITDREPLSLECMALSARANGLEAQVVVHPAGGEPSDCEAQVVVHPARGEPSDYEGSPSPAGKDGCGAPEPETSKGVVSCALLDWSRLVPAELVGR